MQRDRHRIRTGSLNIMGVLLIKSSGETHVSPLTSVGMDSLSPNIIEKQVCNARSQLVPQAAGKLLSFPRYRQQ